MESLLKKFRDLIAEEVDDEYDDYEEEKPQTEPLRVSSRRYRDRVDEDVESNLVKAPTSSKLVVYRPQRFDDMEFVVDSLRSKKSVVLIFDGLSVSLVQRMLDFAAGTVCSLGCTSSMVSETVCIIVPNNIELVDGKN